jgi:hypothetical protein
MITSNEISGVLNAQNQQFMGQNAYANQIGIAPPSGGLDSYSRAPAGIGFDYGPGSGMLGPGYAGGNRMASAALSGIGTASTVAGMGLGVASMFGKLGPMTPMVDPFAAASMGYRAARGIGMGVGAGIAGGIGAAMVPIGLGMAASKIVGSVIEGGHAQMQINGTLGQQYNFFNANSRTGSGFTRDDAKAVGDTVRQMAHIPEMMTSVQELTNIMGKLKGSGVMQGVTQAAEFQKRFKEAVGTIRDVAKTLGTTLEEAETFFTHSRSVGLFGRADQVKNALNVQLASGLTGMTTGQVMQIQSAGANMATQLGAKRSLGTKAITSIAQNLGVAQRDGRLSEGLLEDITGLQGPEAVQAGAERLTGLMTRMSQSPAGRLTMAGLVKFDERGRAVGLDENLVKQFNSGDISMADLKRRASGLTNDQKISFRAREADLAMSFAGQVGPGGMGRFINEVAGGKYGAEGVNLIMQRYGATAGEADLAMQMQRVSSDQEFSQMGRIRGRETSIREKTDPEAMMRRIKTKIHSGLFGGLEGFGAKIQTEVGKAYDEFIDDLVGRHVISLSKEGAETFARAMSGNNGRELKSMFEASHQAGGGSAKISGLGRSLGNSGMMTWVRSIGTNGTGRSDAAEYENLSKLLGTSNGTDFMRKVNAFNGGIPTTPAMQGASQYIDSLKEEGFGDLSDAAKLDQLQGGLQTKLRSAISKATKGRSGSMASVEEGLQSVSEADIAELAGRGEEGAHLAGLLRAAKDAQKVTGKGGDVSTTLIAGAQGKFTGGRSQIDFSRIADPTSSQNFLDVEVRQKALTEAEDRLKGAGLSDATVSMLKDDPTAKKLLMKAMTDTSVAEALDKRDPEVAAQLLREKGIRVSASDIERYREASTELNKAKKSSSGGIFDDIDVFDRAHKAKDFQVILNAMRDTGLEAVNGSDKLSGPMGDRLKELGLAFTGASETRIDPEERQKRLDNARSLLGTFSKDVSKLSKEERNRIIASAGTMGGALSAVSHLRDMEGKSFKNRSELIDAIGLTGDSQAEELVAAAGGSSTGPIKLTSAMVDRLSDRVGNLRLARDSAKGGQSAMSGDKDQMLIDTLRKINGTQEITASVLLAMGEKTGALKEADVNRLKGRMAENSNAGRDGQANPNGGI